MRACVVPAPLDQASLSGRHHLRLPLPQPRRAAERRLPEFKNRPGRSRRIVLLSRLELAAYGTFRQETNFLGYGAERTFARPRLETVLDPVQTFLGFCVDTTSLGPNRNSYRFICLSGTASTIIGFKPACRVAQSVETDRFRIVDILFGVIWPTGGSKNLSACESIPRVRAYLMRWFARK